VSPMVGDQSIEHDGHRLQQSQIWSPAVIEDIQLKAQLGRYRLQGFSTHRRLPSFDDLTFVPCTLSRVALEGYRERCETKTVLGTRFAKKPVVLSRPIAIAGMSYGALSKTAKVALGRAATRLGISTTTGDGGMLVDEREASHILVYQILPSRYGFNTDHLKAADAIEVVIGQGAKPGTGGVLLGSKVSNVIAARCLRALTSGARCDIRTSSALTTCRSRSRSCARRRTGRSRSTSSLGQAGSRMTSSWPSRPRLT
jgi:glutamate synthase domain-containing protein 2